MLPAPVGLGLRTSGSQSSLVQVPGAQGKPQVIQELLLCGLVQGQPSVGSVGSDFLFKNEGAWGEQMNDVMSSVF